MIVSTYRQNGMLVTDHLVPVPLDHARPDGPRIEVFAREVVAAEKADAGLPALLFLQGGPGGKGPRPGFRDGWIGRAIGDYRVILLDQRGTGRSTPTTARSLARLGGPAAQAEYLGLLRADAIVRDAEILRREINDGAPWDTLGQSYGGFITLTYLSLAPEAIRRAFVTGGLPSITRPIEDVYRITFDRMVEKSTAFFDRYASDRALASRIAEHLATHEVRLPTGERLSPRRFQTVGMKLGMKGDFDSLHYLLDEAFAGGELSDAFLAGVNAIVSVWDSPLYAVLQEPIFSQGRASNWAAEREYASRPAFAVDAPEFLFTGEAYFPFHYDEDPALVPLRDAARLLAERADWPALWDVDRLSRNEVPVYAAVYNDDLYVPRELSLETAARVPGIKVWITNEYEHDGLRTADVLDRLLIMARDA